MPVVSVIIPVFNRSLVITRAINSVLHQSFKNFELIVVDDGSTDETEIILSSFINSGAIHYFKQNNLGVSAARNLGASKAQGEWLAFLDSDDEWLVDKLQTQLDFFKINKNLQIAYGEELWIRNGVKVNKKIIHQKFGGWIFDKCIQQCFIAPSSVILKASLFLEMGGFDESFQVCEDYDLWLKISSLYEIGFISTPVMTKHGGHADQLSNQYKAMDLWRIRSLARLLTIRNLSPKERETVIETIQKKGTILKIGFLKYGNNSSFLEVETILKNLFV